MTFTDIAYRVLLESDKPLTAQQIVDRAVHMGLLGRNARSRYMRGQLNLEIRTCEKSHLSPRFIRLNGIYALAGKETKSKSESSQAKVSDRASESTDNQGNHVAPAPAPRDESTKRKRIWTAVTSLGVLVALLASLIKIVDFAPISKFLFPKPRFPTVQPVQTDLLIAVASFWGDNSIPADQYIVEALNKQVQDLQLTDRVSIRKVDYVVSQRDEGIELGKSLDADIIIWGRYSPDRIDVTVEPLNKKVVSSAGAGYAKLGAFQGTLDLYLQPTRREIGICRTRDLPSETSYLALVALGITDYLDGQPKQAAQLFAEASHITFEECKLAKDDADYWLAYLSLADEDVKERVLRNAVGVVGAALGERLIMRR